MDIEELRKLRLAEFVAPYYKMSSYTHVYLEDDARAVGIPMSECILSNDMGPSPTYRQAGRRLFRTKSRIPSRGEVTGRARVSGVLKKPQLSKRRHTNEDSRFDDGDEEGEGQSEEEGTPNSDDEFDEDFIFHEPENEKRKRDTYHCSKCSEAGHTAATCHRYREGEDDSQFSRGLYVVGSAALVDGVMR